MRSEYAEPRLSRDAMLSERLENMFGPGNDRRGAGAKPKKVCHLSNKGCCVD
jgi:hypothetical protein